MIWKDISSYSRSDKQRIPVSWETRILNDRIVVTRIHSMNGWFLRCTAAGFDSYLLPSADIDVAKMQAIDLVSAWAQRFLDALKAGTK